MFVNVKIKDMRNRYGYCCICLSLEDQGVSTNRGMVKKTFLEKGLDYVSEIAIKNTSSLVDIIRFNAETGIKMYRMSSDMFPWMSEYEIKELPSFDEIKQNLLEAGRIARESDQRLTFHPSHFCVLGSLNPDVVKKSLKELEQHSEIMDLMLLERSFKCPINIHVNTTKPTKDDAAERFINVYSLLSDGVKSRLVLENDDKGSQFTPTDLHKLLHSRIGIPITYDYLHHKCNPDGLTEEEGLDLCLSTWPSDVSPLTHYSDSRRLYEDSNCKEVAHSDWIWGDINTYGKKFDIELEVKKKDLALLKYLERI